MATRITSAAATLAAAALAAAAFTPTPEVFAEPDPTPTPAIEPEPVERLDLAQDLPEYTGPLDLPMVSTGIQSFKDEDRRTMIVRILDGALVKQLSAT